jgi:hypothetical protein
LGTIQRETKPTLEKSAAVLKVVVKEEGTYFPHRAIG